MGLATVHGILKQHHGWIAGASQPGEGTTLICYLPVSVATGAPTPLPAASPSRPKPAGFARKARILVVED